MSKRWTEDEINFLEEKWGVLSIKAIANNLGRTIDAVKTKTQKLGYVDAKLSLDGITICKLAQALNISYAIISKHWIPEHAFPAKTKVFAISNKVKYVTYSDFWKWAEKNKSHINFARVEEGILGEEPAWVKEKRKADTLNIERRLKLPWSQEETRKLINLVRLQKYTYPEMEKILLRSEAAIKRKLRDLKIPDRPIGMNKKKWTKEQISTAIDMLNKGYGLNTIGEKIGKTSLSVRGKFERMGIKVGQAM